MSLDWDNNNWDVPTRLLPMQFRRYTAALPPHNDDDWLPATPLGSPAVLLMTTDATEPESFLLKMLRWRPRPIRWPFQITLAGKYKLELDFYLQFVGFKFGTKLTLTPLDR